MPESDLDDPHAELRLRVAALEARHAAVEARQGRIEDRMGEMLLTQRSLAKSINDVGDKVQQILEVVLEGRA